MIRASMKVLCFLALPLAWTGAADAQTTLFVKNYVNSNEIQSVTRWRGLVTMGTLGGVVTIDPTSGAIAKILRSPGGLPSNRVLSVEVSPSGMLWAGTADEGIARLRPDGTFRRPLSSFDGLPSDRVQALYTRGDSVWVGTSGGAALFTENPGTGQIGLTRAFTNATTSGALAGDDVRAFLQVQDTLWVATTTGLSSFAGGVWQNRTPALSLSTTSLVLHADTLWAATSLGPYRYESGVFQPVNSGHTFPSQVLVESTLGFFSGSAGVGVYRYAAGDWQSVGAGLPTLGVSALQDGPDGALWAGTSGGAARLPSGSSVWKPHLSDGPLVNGTQRAVTDSRGVWFTTGNDFPAGTARGVVLHFDGASWSALTGRTTGFAFQEADAFGIFSDSSERIWIGHCCADGTPRPRIDRYDPATGIWDLPPANNIFAFAQSPSGLIYAGGVQLENGVYVFDAQSGARLDSLTPANSGIRSNNLRGVRFDSAGKGWFGSVNGLDTWDGRGTLTHADDLWVHYAAQPDNQVSSIAVIDPLTAWVGTALGAGRIQSGVFGRLLTVAPSSGGPGLPSAQVNDLALDTNGNLWIGTSSGLARADASGGGRIEVFTTEQGLVDDDIRALAWDAARGALWVGTAHGISRVVPSGAGTPGITDQAFVFPNPSRAQGTLRIGGIQNALTGEVFDLAGNLVHRFRCDPAQNEIWDLRAASGEPAPSGVYLIVLHDKTRSKTLRAAVVR